MLFHLEALVLRNLIFESGGLGRRLCASRWSVSYFAFFQQGGLLIFISARQTYNFNVPRSRLLIYYIVRGGRVSFFAPWCRSVAHVPRETDPYITPTPLHVLLLSKCCHSKRSLPGSLLSRDLIVRGSHPCVLRQQAYVHSTFWCIALRWLT